MSALSRWFGRKSEPSNGAPSGDWDRELEALEAEAKRAVRAFQGTPLNRAGDLCLRAGDKKRALSYYGRAIDALLEDGQREAARGVANKIIRVRPTAVRTLCTLTWLDLAAKHSATALLHLRDYVEAAKDVDERQLAARQIAEMARVVPDAEFLSAAADALDGLDFPERASKVREWVEAGGSPDACTDPEELGATCMRCAVHSNDRGR